MNKQPSLRDLFHEFLNAVNGINVETQTFPLAVQLRSLEKAMEHEDVSVKEKIESILKVAFREYNRACSVLKSIESFLDRADAKGHKECIEEDITSKLIKIKSGIDNINTMTMNMRKDEDIQAILDELLKLRPNFQSVALSFRQFKAELISKGVYNEL